MELTLLHNIIILNYNKLCNVNYSRHIFRFISSRLIVFSQCALIFFYDFYNFDITDASAFVKYTLKVSFIVLLGRCDATVCTRIYVCVTRSNSNHVYAITPR